METTNLNNLNSLNNLDRLNSLELIDYNDGIDTQIGNGNNNNENNNNAVVRWTYEKYLPKNGEAILDVIERYKEFTVGNLKINYDDDCWDFSSLKAEGRMGKYKFNFKENKYYNYQLKDKEKFVLKFYVFTLINERNINNIRGELFTLPIRIFKYMDDNIIDDISEMTLDDYKKIVSNASPRAYNDDKNVISQFLSFYSIFFEKIYTKEIAGWLRYRDLEGVRIQAQSGKTRLLPSPFYNKLIALMYSLCMDDNLNNFENNNENKVGNKETNIEIKTKETPDLIKMLAGLIYIGTQTGIREGELSLLRTQDLHMMEFDGKVCGTIFYRITKTARGKNHNYNIADTNANEKVCEVYKKLVELGKDARKKYKTDLLIPAPLLNNHLSASSPVKNVSSESLTKVLKCFCIKYSKYLDIINTPDAPDFHIKYIVDTSNPNDYNNPLYSKRYIAFDEKNPLIENDLKDGDVISIPSFKQFRVYADTELMYHGVNARIRAHIKGHTKPAMLNYYARPRQDIENEITLKKDIVNEVSSGNSNILGVGSKTIDLQEKLDTFLRRRKKGLNAFDNVEDNIDEFIEYLDETVCLTRKYGGFCMKSHPDRKCHYGVDEHADEYLCASGVCPYHCFMYYNLPETLATFEDLKITYNNNISNGWKNAAQKEGHKIKYLINKTLIPQLDETDKVIKKIGADAILEKYPQMKNYLNTSELRKDIEKWKSKVS